MSEYCFVVFTRPVEGQEETYNSWYDNQHISDVLATPGFVSARRFVSEQDGLRQYLAIYGMETDDPDAVLAGLHERAGTDRMPMSPALDADSISAVLYRPLSPAVRR